MCPDWKSLTQDAGAKRNHVLPEGTADKRVLSRIGSDEPRFQRPILRTSLEGP
jgi:hypothetical protein